MRRYPTTWMPYEPIFVKGNTLSIDVAAAKRLILFTGHKDKLAGHNEHALDPRIQTGFGIGINDSAMPFENGVGTLRLLNDPTDNVWLTKIDGSGKNKVFTSGYLQANNHLSVDTTNHTITEEFVVRNNGPGTDVQVIDDCSSVDGWSKNTADGDVTISVVNGVLRVAGTSAATGGSFTIKKNYNLDLSNKAFIKFDFTSNVNANLYFLLYDGTYAITWSASRLNVIAGVTSTFVLPIKAPSGSVGSVPSNVQTGFNFSAVTQLRIGIGLPGSTACEITIDNVTVCNGTWAQVEVAVPDKIDYSKPYIGVYTHDATNYESKTAVVGAGNNTSRIYGSASAGIYLDGTLMRYVLNVPYCPIGVYVEGKKTQTVPCVTGTTGTPINFTYSSIYGTCKRIGFAILMPPSDNGRTGMNQCRLKLITYYDQLGSTTYEFSNDTDLGTGIGCMKKPYFAFWDPAKQSVEYYILTKKPLGGSYKFNETGTISNITFQLDANTRVYRGQLKHVNLTIDSDADMIPNFLDSNEAVSIEHLIGHLNFI